ncbi:MAG: PmeII family type II restriction endonuclease [Bacteroidota bacterium]
MRTAEKLIEEILNAYLSSSEEELFGVFLEGLAIYVAENTMNTLKMKKLRLLICSQQNFLRNSAKPEKLTGTA